VRRRLVRSLLFLGAVFVGGTVGYRLIEDAPWWDSFYMTAITLTTVGYREVFPLSRGGQVFTVLLLLAGLGLLLVVATEVARSVVEGELATALGHRRRSRMMERLADHEIVCGWGRMGQSVVEELQRLGRSFAVVERSAEKIARLRAAGAPYVEGDATAESTLRSAGVDRARGLVACLNDDAHNVYTVLTARSLNPRLYIVARAGQEGAEERILRAGADRVVNPYHLGGLRLAHVLVKPAVVDFLEVSLGPRGAELQLEQVRLEGLSPLVGRTLAATELRSRWGIGVVAVQRGEKLFPNPEPQLELATGDVLVVLGPRERLERFEGEVCRQAPAREV